MSDKMFVYDHNVYFKNDYFDPSDKEDSHIDVDGNRVPWKRRTKITHPYSYDPIVQWKGAGKATGTVYSDRLYEWEWDKYNDLRMKHFGNRAQMWYNESPQKVQDFLRDYFNDSTLVLTKIIEYCNQSTGYPVWRFDYISTKGK